VVPFAEGKLMAEAIPGARFVPLLTNNHVMLADEPAFATFLTEARAFASADHAGAVEKPQRLELDSDRRQVTVLALEIVSPLQAFELDDPEVFADHLDPLFDQVAATVERHYGTILSRADGALTAVFGAAHATEEHAYLACRAALAAKSVVDVQSEGTARLRAGIDTGEALLRRHHDRPAQTHGGGRRAAARRGPAHARPAPRHHRRHHPGAPGRRRLRPHGAHGRGRLPPRRRDRPHL
jgi:class 3 adenylate cyclase